MGEMETRIRAIEEDLDRNRDAHKEFYSRIRELEQSAALNRQMIEELKEIKADVKDLKEKPARRWEMVATQVIQWLIVAALAASALFK